MSRIGSSGNGLVVEWERSVVCRSCGAVCGTRRVNVCESSEVKLHCGSESQPLPPSLCVCDVGRGG